MRSGRNNKRGRKKKIQAVASSWAASARPPPTTAGEPASIFENLNNHKNLLAVVLSYVIEDTAALARLRTVSKDWNVNVIPYIFKSRGGHLSFLRNCAPSKYRYVSELVKFDEDSYGGRYYEIWDDYNIRLFCKINGNEDGSPKMVSRIGDMWFLRDSEFKNPPTALVTKHEDFDFIRDTAPEFAKICAKMQYNNDWDDLTRLATEGIMKGMFLCKEDLEQAKLTGATIPARQSESWAGRYLPMLLTIRFKEDENIDLVGTTEENQFALFRGMFPKTGEYAQSRSGASMFFVHYRNAEVFQNDQDATNIYPTFVGYNVLKWGNGNCQCQVPILLEIGDDITEFMWDCHDGPHRYPPFDCLWPKCQQQPVREGVAIADGFVKKDLRDRLMSQIDALLETQIVDYHPNSNDVVRDIIHPALYAYVKGVSELIKPVDQIGGLQEENPLVDSGRDYWGRKYESSAKYQWLPTYFDIGVDGSCKICDYINNLVPRVEHEDLYDSLAQLFSQALPLIESVYGYCREVKEEHLRFEDYEETTYNRKPVNVIQEQRVSLRGRQVQVVTKIVDYELGEGQSYEGVWHVEGMSHEEIVATAIYFIDRDDEIEGGDILFKRAFHKQDADYIFSNVGQVRPACTEDKIREGLTPLGKVETRKGRLLVFPNSHIHKVTKMTNNTKFWLPDLPRIKKKRRIIVFFLINPEKRIVSTREVAVQQEHAQGSMKREDALKRRLELMKERKYTKQDWNVREIELCEH